jgi:AcrR family transcriptional regulator
MASQRVESQFAQSGREQDENSDGRVLRGERTRVLIVSAILALLREGVVRPTAEQIAARAQVGVRTVFRHFDDMENLYAAMNAVLGEEIRLLLGPEADPFAGAIKQRVRELVRRRLQIYECVAPARRRTFEREARSTEVQTGLVRFNRLLAAQTREAVGPELEGHPADLLEALDAVLSFEYWDRLRRVQHIGRSRVATILERTVILFLEDPA